ncbi:hypothetical protein AAG570_006209 [Ranatra chinensis]|uniref:CCHC-type domain-containing protein n=1 Tax=Ranatra chinensis TaxID=642074 RepID=A0ABD0ZEI8_9HEMI
MEGQMSTSGPPQLTIDVNTVSGLAMTAILNMPEFHGDPEQLADFLEAASAAGAHLRSVNILLPAKVINNLYGILIRKISHPVRAECGITGLTEAAEVASLLSERYGGARRPPARSAVKLLRMKRGQGETPSAFMHRVEQAFRLVKARMADVEAAGVATAKLAVIEELLKEAVMSELLEKLRRQLKPLSASNFGVLLTQVDEEEDDYQAAREDASSWTRVERRSTRRPDRGHEQSAPQATTHPANGGAAPGRATGGSVAGSAEALASDGRLRCWECGSTRHLAHACPQIYRRDQREAGRRPRPEPMELQLRLFVGRGLAQASSASAATEPEGGSAFIGGDQYGSTRPRFEGPAEGIHWWGAIGGLPKAMQENWGCKVLVDTGSTSTLIKVGVIRAQGWEAGVVPCGCVATTVSGPTPLRGEIVLSLKGLSGKDKSVIAHVMDWTSTEYEAILGTDALKCVNGQVRVNGSEWAVKLGKSRYRPEGRVSLRSYVGAAVIGERNLITRANVLECFGEVFHREGEPLSATGRVWHEIVIPDNRVVYVKPRRYPQALMEVMEGEVRNLLSQGITRKSVSPYCSPLWVVPKTPDAQGNPRYRVVVDFKVLNKYTRPEKYPLPRLEEMLDRMSGASVFSLLDL